MARAPRLHVPGGFYHATLRGNHRERIFRAPGDWARLDDIAADALERSNALLHAYCWMTNHLHMLVQVGDRPLSELMQRIGTRFARAVQRHMPTTGHLFENRYHASLVDTDAYFLQLLCYIHLNPVRAGIVSAPALYRWSSHAEYAGTRRQPWVTIDFGLRMFHSDLHRSRELYVDFLGRQAAVDMEPDFAEAHHFETGAAAERVSVAADVPEQNVTTTLERLAIEACAESRISLHELRSAARTARLARARDRLAALAVERRVASLSEVARFLNRSVAAISRSAARHRRHGNART
jgi:REP-associated tyrosine transposase